MLQIKLFGQFDARRDGIPLAIPSRAAQSLLAYLLLNVTSVHRREKLAGLLWPNTLESSSRHNLRHELWRLRKVIDSGMPASDAASYLLADEFSIGFNPDSNYWLDVSVLEQASSNPAFAGELGDALALYAELLPGFYDDWVVLDRERLHALFEQKMACWLGYLEREQRWKDALEWGERWIALGGTPEPAYRTLMLAYSAMGNQAKVGATFQRCADSLRRDLGVEPSDQTLALFDRLRTGSRPIHAGLPASFPPESVSARLYPPTALALGDVSPAPGVPPFKGLVHFDEGDADLFFGRELLTARLVAHLNADQFLVVVGASGSGKSSVVRAGMVPALKQASQTADGELLPDARIITPTAHPLDALAAALTDGEPSTTAALAEELARDPRSLRLAMQRSLEKKKSTRPADGARPRLLLVVDQFEELFTLCRDEFEREAFVDNLLMAMVPSAQCNTSLVITLRADFYTHCAQYPDLRQALAEHQEYIGPMNSEELRRAVEEPARRGGWQFEPGLVDWILRDVGDEPGMLPLLSHALLECWKRRSGRTLTLKGYAETGGVSGAIAKTAETVFKQLTPEQQLIARSIFLRLTELGEGTQDTRRRATLSELVTRAEEAAAVELVVHTLADARLITTGAGTVQVAHEALIREWHTLREWLNEDREGLRLHRHLTDSAQSWQKLNQEAGELYRGVRLEQSLEWATAHARELNPLECEFLDASRSARDREQVERELQQQRELQAAQRLANAESLRAEEQSSAARKLRRSALLLAGALAIAAVLAFAAILFARRAENERHIAFARELSVNAVNNLSIDPERSILLALQAVSSSSGGKPVLREAEEALHRAVQSSRVQLTLRGHAAGLWNIAYSPDGRYLATASNDKTAKVWDSVTGNQVLTLRGHTDVVDGIDYSPDGTRIATSGPDKSVKIWDAATGRELLTLSGHSGAIPRISFSPDGKYLASASLDKTAKVWDIATGHPILSLDGHTGGVSSVAYSPDGKRLATGSWTDEVEHTAKIWDASTGQVLFTLKGHTAAVWDIAISPDGKRIATGSGDGTAKIWDSATGQLLTTLFGHGGALRVTYSPDGTQLATGNADGSVIVWDAATGQLLQTLAGHTGEVWGAAYSPEGKRLATASQDSTAKVWDVSSEGSRDAITLVGHKGMVRDVAYSPDGTRLATVSADKTARIWDVNTGNELLALYGHMNDAKSVAFSPDGSRLATTSVDQTVRVWDAATGNAILTLSSSSMPLPLGLRVAFSYDGRKVAAPAANGAVKVWDAVAGDVVLVLCCHTTTASGIAFSPDGTRLVTGGMDGIAKVWDTTTGKELSTLAGHKGLVYSVAYSPDGRRVATACQDGTAKVWDASTSQVLLTLVGHSGSVIAVAFSPDSRIVATASLDGTVKLWDVSSSPEGGAQPLSLYNPNMIAFTGVAFSPDGKRLAASSNDGTARIYALPLGDIIAIAKSRVTRALTNDECQKYLHIERCPVEP